MSGLRHGLDERYFRALVKGVIRCYLLEDAAITPGVVRESVFAESDIPRADQDRLIENLRLLLGAAAHHDWSPEELAREVAEVPEADATSLGTVWRAQREKVRSALAIRSAWQPTLRGLSWRADVVTGAQRRPQLQREADQSGEVGTGGSDDDGDAAGNVPEEVEGVGEGVAVLELKVGPRSEPVESSETIHVQLNREDARRLVQSLDDVQAQLERLGGSASREDTAASPTR